MRVFVTGATGFIGSAVVRELVGAGHQVVGLARSDKSAEALTAAGIEVKRGNLNDLDSLKAGAEASDGVIHTAFNTAFNNFSETTNFVDTAEADRRAIETLGEALAGTNRPLIVTSGTALLRPGRLAMEEDTTDSQSFAALRIPSEEAALSFAQRGVRVSVVRPPLSVHGKGDHGFIPALIHIAKSKGVSAYLGKGSNRWSAVHLLDLSHLFRLALEKAPAGARLHGVGEEGIPFQDIANVIGQHLEVPVTAISPEEADEHFGFLAAMAKMDNPASSTRTQEQLGWSPMQPGLITDIARNYFTNE
ncbi:SDR family oxidoreductase [Paenibacillus sp. XY044]|uniref:SDR family oxidoreductase n=1 Tax=Paenibacillus sp. XY044 TaxID=2026089 RepID=UPI000B982C4E|nr:SDR family oxidoreductase [Paenibacillus sp. XY044]OZB98489.1 3-beta hydroxysteroid dehydrogenase [Paenibacillus sp. XY044]